MVEEEIKVRWEIIESCVNDIKKIFNERQATFGERFMISDVVTSELTRELNINLLGEWFSEYMEEAKIPKMSKPLHFQ